VIINSQISFTEYDPYIKTEETIFNLLERDKDLISDMYELMPYPLAHWINTLGIDRTNELINSLSSDKKRIFICQHIYVNNLVFRDSDIIFTPHSSKNDRFITIPHYAVNVNENLIKSEKVFDFSFLGSTTTHNIRKSLVAKYPDKCFDSKVHWGLEKGMSNDFNNQYTRMLGESIFSVCPRGTGISSVRLFESMAMGSIPIIVADGYDPPLSDIIDWNSISITLPEKYILDNLKIEDNLDRDRDIKSMVEIMDNIYNEYFSNENLHKTIIISIDK